MATKPARHATRTPQRKTSAGKNVASRASSARRAPSASRVPGSPAKAAKAARGGRGASRQGAAARKSPARAKRADVMRRGAAVRSITPFLWFDGRFQEAARFYTSLFPDSRIVSTNPMGGEFELCGQRFMGLDGGPQFRFTPAVSFFTVCRDQAEVDRLWAALSDGGKPSRCGWIDDRFGLTWQIVPEAFLRLTADPDPRKVQAVFQAMMGMVKMDVKGLQAAYDAA